MIKYHIKQIFWFYLAGLTWLLELLMFASIILIPLLLFLRTESDWLSSPFYEAYMYH